MKMPKSGKSQRMERPKMLHHMEVKEAENGGHVITHHFENGPGMDGYHEPEEHVFGADEGQHALEHIASAANIHMPETSESEGSETGENTEEA
jgi:hypothetical protein